MNKLKNSLQLVGILLSYCWIVSLIVKSVDGLAYETFYIIVSWIAVFQISTASELIKSLLEDEPEDKPDTKAIPWIKSIPDQPVTTNQVHAGNFWDCYPWANFVTQDSDGDIYAWEKEPQKDEDTDLPQWVLPYQPTAVNSFDCFKTAPANYREPNWQDHIAKRGEMPEWLKKSLL